jgi:hypothetical protein
MGFFVSSLWDNQLESSLLADIEDSEHLGASLSAMLVPSYT